MAGEKTQAKAYFLEFPGASITNCVEKTGISPRTCAQARSELVKSGLIKGSRKASALRKDPGKAPSLPSVPLSAPPMVGDTLLTDKALTALAGSGDMSDILDLDDEDLRKKLLRGVIRIALDPSQHPDTQLSATQVWAKLKDMARVNDLGPGKPVTKEDAVARLTEMLVACGSDTALTAMYAAFNVPDTRQEAGNGEGAPPIEESVAPEGQSPSPEAPAA